MTNGMKHETKSRIATLKRKMQEVVNCIMDALAQIKAYEARISMDDPDAAPFMDIPADTSEVGQKKPLPVSHASTGSFRSSRRLSRMKRSSTVSWKPAKVQ